MVDFWLLHCVLPLDTRQFPERLTATSWDLADNARQVGFSGTKDSHRLLPLQVRAARHLCIACAALPRSLLFASLHGRA